MSLQTSVNAKLAFGVVGSFYDDSPRRVAPYIVYGNPTDAVKATGELAFGSTNAVADDTVTIGATVYTFKAAVSTTANQVKVGTTLADSLANLKAAVNGGEGSGTVYGSATTANPIAEITTISSGDVTVSAKEAGAAGNGIYLAASVATATAFSGGADKGADAKVGIAYTVVSGTDNKAQVGGTGAFAGLLVNPSEYVKDGLGATMIVENNTVGQLCTMGHVNVKSLTEVAVGYVAAYDKTSGEISGYASAGSIPATSAQIANAKFITKGGAGETVVLELS